MRIKDFKFINQPRRKWTAGERELFWDTWFDEKTHDGAEYWQEQAQFIEADTGVRFEPSFDGWLEFLKSLGWNGNKNVHPKIKLEAVTNHGRWLVDCPFCAGAEYAWIDSPYFVCGSCFNRDIDGQIVRVVLLAKAERIQVEAELEKRPRALRNRARGETAEILVLQNKILRLG